MSAIALGLADALHQEELEKLKKLAKFADRTARIRQVDFGLYGQLEQFHGLSLGASLIEPPPQTVVRDEPRRERSAPRIRPITLRDSVGFTFTGKSERTAVDPAKRIVLTSGKDKSWRSFSNLSTLSIDPVVDNRRKVRKRKKLLGGGIEEIVEIAVAAVLEELRLTEDDETRVIEDTSEERVIE